MTEEIKLTQYAKGAGCGCKIAPAALEEILKTTMNPAANIKLLVGNGSMDDAAVYDAGNGTALISTTDFFMPVVDDAFDFGRIASANAISDVYAMGGKPLMAIAILGWPLEKLPATLAQKVLDGSRTICAEAGISLAGGHTVDSLEPFFGLAVTGTVDTTRLKRNNTAKDGDILFLTKPIGVGILTTAQKRGVLNAEHHLEMIDQMVALNKVGEELGGLAGVHAMTDVTGFGLLGHLIEMAEGSNLSAELQYSSIPVCAGATEYLTQRIVPDATYRNWNSYSSKVQFDAGVDVMQAFSLLPDPQTNGGLLVAVAPEAVDAVQQILKNHQLHAHPVGILTGRGDKTVTVRN